MTDEQAMPKRWRPRFSLLSAVLFVLTLAGLVTLCVNSSPWPVEGHFTIATAKGMKELKQQGTHNVQIPSSMIGLSEQAQWMQLSSDETMLIGLGYGMPVIWSVQERRMLAYLPDPAQMVPAVFTRKGDLVATGSMEGTVRVWRTETGEPVMYPVRRKCQTVGR